MRIKLQAEAVLCILELVEAGKMEMISSDALIYEAQKNPNGVRQVHTILLLAKASSIVTLNDDIKQRSRELVSLGFKPMDAFHLASAEAAKADWFCTCDDRLCRSAKKCAGLSVKVATPIDLTAEINL